MKKLTLTIADDNGNVVFTTDTDYDVGPFLALIDANEDCLDEATKDFILAAADKELNQGN